MDYFYLLEAANRQDARKIIKSLASKITRLSSLYLSQNKIYLILSINSQIKWQTNKTTQIRQCFKSNLIQSSLELLVNWGISEILQDINYVEYEAKAIQTDKGCMLLFGQDMIIKSFLHLTEQMLIINSTPDSFSEKGNLYQKTDEILVKVVKSLHEGVSIIDVGAESTRPGATALTNKEELNRLSGLLEAINSLRADFNFQLSLDSYKEETIEALIDKIDIINDVTGNISDRTLEKLVCTGKKYVCMHSLTVPANREINLPINQNPVETLKSWAIDKLEKLTNLGLSQENVILDLGIGFNKTQDQSWYLLRNIKEFMTLDTQIMVGHSRKGFINKISQTEFWDRDLETAIISSILSQQLVDYIRVHDWVLYTRICKVNSQLVNQCLYF